MTPAGPSARSARPPIGHPGRGLAARLLLAASAVVGSSSLASAHPDIAIEDRVTFLFRGAQVTGIEETWTFDPNYSQSFLTDYKAERDGSISAAGSKLIAGRIQPNLAEVRYFTYVSLDGRDLGNLPVRDFVATASDERLTFTFVVDLPAPVDPRRQALKLEIYDHDYYAAILLADDNPVRFRNQKGISCEPRLREDIENAYFGDIYPQEITLSCR
ncbi:MAG TPA: DUF1007 family protein [Stellaceae bacterium]|nr:DUF1007 family protein [Stellaceae bacterium]